MPLRLDLTVLTQIQVGGVILCCGDYSVNPLCFFRRHAMLSTMFFGNEFKDLSNACLQTCIRESLPATYGVLEGCRRAVTESGTDVMSVRRVSVTPWKKGFQIHICRADGSCVEQEFQNGGVVKRELVLYDVTRDGLVEHLRIVQ